MFGRLRRALTDTRIMNTLFPEAERIAMREGQPAPAAEHLLLAALALPDGTAKRAFERVGIDSDRLQHAVAAQHAAALDHVSVIVDDNAIDAALPHPPDRGRGVFRYQPSAQALFQKVIELAKAQHTQLYGAYFVDAATQIEHGAIPRALAIMGVSREQLAHAARLELDLLCQTDQRTRR